MDKKAFELRILGATELSGPGERPADGIVRQPKRLALLSYLAITTASGFRRRDEVIALFWPELDQTQGRTYLRKALHAIRDELDEDLFVTRGDDEVSVNRDRLWCDAAELTRLGKASLYREALGLYRGELLAGLYPEGVAQEFEEWLRLERKTLRHEAALAAWECAKEEEQRGDTAAAASLARRALEIEPDNEEGVRRLMTLLDGRGERAGALRVYKEWQAHLQDEFGVEPAPETRRLARAVQAARKGESHETPPAPLRAVDRSFVSGELVPVPRASRRRTRELWIYAIAGAALVVLVTAMIFHRSRYPRMSANAVTVLPFRAIGDPASRPVAEAIEEEITTALALDSTFTVRSAPLTSRDSPRDARKLAVQVGSAYVIDGAVQRSAGRTRITLRLIRTSDASVVWAGVTDAAAADEPSVARNVATKVAEALKARVR
jgi:DNA-binding SARP family transcriptional activator/TolB-like protein